MSIRHLSGLFVALCLASVLAETAANLRGSNQEPDASTAASISNSTGEVASNSTSSAGNSTHPDAQFWTWVFQEPTLVKAFAAGLWDMETNRQDGLVVQGPEGDLDAAPLEEQAQPAASEPETPALTNGLAQFEEGTAFWDSIFESGDATSSLDTWLKGMSASDLQAWQRNVTSLSSSPSDKDWAVLATRVTALKLEEMRNAEAARLPWDYYRPVPPLPGNRRQPGVEYRPGHYHPEQRPRPDPRPPQYGHHQHTAELEDLEATPSSFAEWGPHGRDRPYGPSEGSHHSFRGPGDYHYNPNPAVQEATPSSFAEWGPHGRDRPYGPSEGNHHSFRGPGDQHYSPNPAIQELPPPAYVPPLPGTDRKPRMNAPGDSFRPGRLPPGRHHLPFYGQDFGARAPGVQGTAPRQPRIPPGHHLPVYSQSFADREGYYPQQPRIPPGHHLPVYASQGPRQPRIPPGHHLPVYASEGPEVDEASVEDPGLESMASSAAASNWGRGGWGGHGRGGWGGHYGGHGGGWGHRGGHRGWGHHAGHRWYSVPEGEAPNQQGVQDVQDVQDVQAESTAGAGWGDRPLKEPSTTPTPSQAEGHTSSEDIPAP